MYQSKWNGEFDKAELLLYEEVTKMPPFKRRTLAIIGTTGVGRRTLKGRLINSDPDKFAGVIPCKYMIFVKRIGYLFNCYNIVDINLLLVPCVPRHYAAPKRIGGKRSKLLVYRTRSNGTRYPRAQVFGVRRTRRQFVRYKLGFHSRRHKSGENVRFRL